MVGTGIITELNAFYLLTKSLSPYGNSYYLMNPRDENGVSTTNGKSATDLQLRTGADIYSVPDVYTMRAGIYYNMRYLSITAGLREEGVPVQDLLGESNGLRRPGQGAGAG